MSKTYSVELKGVRKLFGEVAAVNHIDLQVHKGEFFSLLGPSGCGKTTCLRMIGGLEAPDAGEIFINNVCVNRIPPYERDASIVFQNLALFPHMSVAANIAFGLKLKKLPKRHIERTVAAMLALVQLSGLGKRRPDQLSGGQQQRVAVARSLVLQPEVLLLDEPLAALDRKLRKEMQVELRRIQRDVGTTFIYVTHDQKEALSMSDRIAVMKDGVVAQLGTPSQIYESPRTRFVADFMGAANVFEIETLQRHNRGLRLRTLGGLVVYAPFPSSGAHTPSGLSIRPEAIRLHARQSDAQGENVFEGKVVSSVYLGDVIEVEIALACGERLVALSNTASHAPPVNVAQAVWVSWAAADSNLLHD